MNETLNAFYSCKNRQNSILVSVKVVGEGRGSYTLYGVTSMANIKTSMDSKRFKRKKFAPSHVDPKFPELLNGKPYIGIYNGHNVSIIEKRAIRDIYNEGNFGKGSLSKSAPNRAVVGDIPEILMQQQWENRLKWQMQSDFNNAEENTVCIDSIQKLFDTTYIKKNDLSTSYVHETWTDPLGNIVEEILHTGKLKEEKQSCQEDSKLVLVVEDRVQSVTDEELKLSKVTVKIRKCMQSIRETLKLNLVEAFFLCFAVRRIEIVNEDGVTMSFEDLWKQFNLAEDGFISKYVAYHHYRSHGWTVRSGIKFGGDYLLYKIGPAYYHASYLVWLMDKKKKNSVSWNEFVTLNRLVETYNKDLLLCEIIDSNAGCSKSSSHKDLSQFSLLQAKCKRWIPSQQRA